MEQPKLVMKFLTGESMRENTLCRATEKARAGSWEGMRTATFQFSESGSSLNGLDLFTE